MASGICSRTGPTLNAAPVLLRHRLRMQASEEHVDGAHAILVLRQGDAGHLKELRLSIGILGLECAPVDRVAAYQDLHDIVWPSRTPPPAR